MRRGLTIGIGHLGFGKGVSLPETTQTAEPGMMTKIVQFLKGEEATTAVEYAVMLALILLTIFGSVVAFGGGAASWWGNINTEIGTYF